MLSQKNHRSGFTLIELLIVIAIIAILAAITLIAINPARQLRQSRNAQRQSDINAILNSVSQYSIDNSGTYPDCVPAVGAWSLASLCGDGVGTDVTPTYIQAIATDPNPDASVGNAGPPTTGQYEVTRLTGGRVQVCAPSFENIDDGTRTSRCVSR